MDIPSVIRINSITKNERQLKKKKKKKSRSWFIENSDNPASRNNINVVVTGHYNERSTRTSSFIRCECLLPQLLYTGSVNEPRSYSRQYLGKLSFKTQRIADESIDGVDALASRKVETRCSPIPVFRLCALRIEEGKLIFTSVICQSSIRSNLMSSEQPMYERTRTLCDKDEPYRVKNSTGFDWTIGIDDSRSIKFSFSSLLFPYFFLFSFILLFFISFFSLSLL